MANESQAFPTDGDLAGIAYAFTISTSGLAPQDRDDFTDALAWEEQRRNLAQMLERNSARKGETDND